MLPQLLLLGLTTRFLELILQVGQLVLDELLPLLHFVKRFLQRGQLLLNRYLGMGLTPSHYFLVVFELLLFLFWLFFRVFG